VEGDLIFDVAGRAIGDPDELLDAIGSATVPYQVKILRGAEGRT
jgi:hypothetical protein